jgi:ribokinase
MAGDVVRSPGGKGANQAAAAARLGARVSLMASLGQDSAGDWMHSVLADYGVDLEFVQRSPRPTGTAFITVEDGGENEIVVSPGANADLDTTGVSFDSFDIVLAQMEVNQRVIDDVARRAARLVLNVAPAALVNPDTLARCAVVVANEIEAEHFDLATLEHCVITRGERGAVHYRLGHEVARAMAPRVEPIDTVGAGDVFCAAYAVQVAINASPEDALQFAVGAGSLATLATGAQGALPTREEVRQWLA